MYTPTCGTFHRIGAVLHQLEELSTCITSSRQKTFGSAISINEVGLFFVCFQRFF